jgi:hypothetical protein
MLYGLAFGMLLPAAHGQIAASLGQFLYQNQLYVPCP